MTKQPDDALVSNPGPLQRLQLGAVAMTKRFLSKSEVRAKVNLSYTEIARRVKAGKFPMPLRLGSHRTSRTVFVESEVDNWMDDQIQRNRRPG